MNYYLKWIAAALLVITFLIGGCANKRTSTTVLVFSKTDGFRHSSIETGVAAVKKLGEENGFAVEATEDASQFTEENLKRFSAIIFLNTTMDVLDYRQQADFERYIQAGGGFVGIHAATDTEYHWPWYGKLVGAYFSGHPSNPNVRTATMNILNTNHLSTSFLKGQTTWERTDEFYNFKNINEAVTQLISIDESTYEGGTNGDNHPMSWYHEFDGGRSFYTNFGHTEESFSEPDVLKHILGGIQYAIGENLELDYSLAKSERVPADDRFVMTVLEDNLDEPMELEVLKDGKILFTGRKGMLRMYDPEVGYSKVVGELDVHTVSEDGMFGMAIDPNFYENHWIYIYYSPKIDEAVNHLSRFVFVGDTLDKSSEKLMLVVPTQRDECCHTGGSIEFDPQGNMFLSTGDNTNPFETGYAPTNELPGRSPWDAQKSSANPNDYRGKVLRITPQPDGTYTIPDGNLFPKDGSEGKPEIYVMGCRNPYRISIDPHSGYLYWGDVGPDARKDSTRGPMGYDEVNQARKAGFFGWPLFIANNKPYMEVDFDGHVHKALYDPLHPINNSPNNTGKQELPPAQEAFIYYPYSESKEFPIVKEGGRNAMAGPVFYADQFPSNAKVFPSYYEGKLFIYDFIRDWILAVTMNEAGDLQKIEPFMPDLKLSSPMDMQFGPDGSLYLLEYGTVWFARNRDARLIKIDFAAGNRPPIARMDADAKVGAAPFTVAFSGASTSDYDAGDELKYSWNFEDGSETTTGKEVAHTFEKAGIYHPKLTVTDQAGASHSTQMEIRVGNQPPDLSVSISGNKSFFWESVPINYVVDVADKEDGSLSKGQIPKEAVTVTFGYLEESNDPTIQAQGHAANAMASTLASGENLIKESGCIACHGMDKEIVGPSYGDVAKKYHTRTDAREYLTGKILSGGSGVWGGKAMPMQSQLTEEQASTMAAFILSLLDNQPKPKNLPPAGSLRADQHRGAGEWSSYTLQVSYEDKGGEVIGPLRSDYTLRLRSPKVQGEECDVFGSKATRFQNPDNGPSFVQTRRNGYSTFRNIDLTGIGKLDLRYAASISGIKLELRLDSPDGQLIASKEVPKTGSDRKFKNMELELEMDDVSGFHDLFFVVVAETNPNENRHVFSIDWMYFYPEKSLMASN